MNYRKQNILKQWLEQEERFFIFGEQHHLDNGFEIVLPYQIPLDGHHLVDYPMSPNLAETYRSGRSMRREIFTWTLCIRPKSSNFLEPGDSLSIIP